MKQMQGLMAQFETDINQKIFQYVKKVQGKLSHTKFNIKKKILSGTQHSINPNTIAMAIFNTFLFLYARCCSALVDCSPGIFCELSLVTVIE